MEGSSNAPLKVLMTTDTIGGVWTYTVELCKALASNNVLFHLVTMGAPLQQWQRLEIEEAGNVTVYETNYMLEWMNNPWGDIAESGEFLLELEREIEPDIIHLNSFSYGNLAFNAPKLVIAHSDVYSWWKAVRNEEPPVPWREYYSKVTMGLDRADLVMAPSFSTMNDIKNIYKFSGRTRVIYNSRTRGLFHYGSKEATIMSMGRLWDEAKNVGLLIEAAGDIPYTIKVAGEHAQEQNRLTSGRPNIEYLGRLSTVDIAATLSTAAVYVLPARYEPFGLSALEAALSGCALVLGDISSLREIWGSNALYVQPDDPGALAATINELMSDQSLRLVYATKAYSHAQRYTVQFGRNYLAAYHHLMHANNKFFYKATA